MVSISAFEVPPEADEELVAAWRRVPGPGVLYRALRPDAKLRFVLVSDAFAELPFEAHAGLYEAVHEDGAPDGSEGATLINAFEVPAEEDAHFLAAWRAVREPLSTQRGYLGTRLHRSTGDADYRFVNVARWSSPLMFARASKLPEVGEAVAAMPFASHPALYLAVGG